MKIVAISDLHGTLPEIPPCDLLLIGGDLCPRPNHREVFQAQWLDTEFRRWLDSLGHVRRVVGIAGNHDFVFHYRPTLVPGDLNWTYLQDRLVEIEGLRIWGTPWQPIYHDWAFNATDEQRQRLWAQIPEPLDVLLVHGPPRGYGDAVQRGSGRVEQTGCPYLLQRIRQIRPELVIFGHIHEGRGQWQLGPTTLANVCILDIKYHLVHPPWVYETRP
jgi:Icc-related predicted phosphoesterase